MLPRFLFTLLLITLTVGPATLDAADPTADAKDWLWTTAHEIPKHTTSEGSGYFSLIEGKDGRVYVGTARYGENCFLVEFDPGTKAMKVVVDAHKEIGTNATGFAAQSKFHTRNNVGVSGLIYLGTKQGYPKDGENLLAYPGGYPMVFDPATGRTRVYPIPVPHHGIISVTPDEPRGVAYVSTTADRRPVESSHFLQLDLKTGEYRDFLDCEHPFAFVVVDWLGRAYHPIRGGEIARFDPRTDQLERLKQTIDGAIPTAECDLADPGVQAINWELSPDRKTLFAVPLNDNHLYAYDLTTTGDTLPGRTVSKILEDTKHTDCRAMCVGPDGTVWIGVAVTVEGQKPFLRVVSHDPRSGETKDHGRLAVRNPDFTSFKNAAGETLPSHHGYHEVDGQLVPRYVIMGICAARDGTVYLTTLYPFTLHASRPELPTKKPEADKKPRVAAIVNVYHHNSHADVIVSRLMQTDTLDGLGKESNMELVALFVDQPEDSDWGLGILKRYGVPVYDTIQGALTLGSGELAVDGVLVVGEHGKYPRSSSGQTIYPKRRLFGKVVDVFEKSGRVVPIFHDKHIADNWEDAKWIYDHAQRLKIPMMAGSSLPTLWRYPPVDLERGAPVQEVVATSYSSLDAYGFHALEMVQCLVERRKGGETGIVSARCFTGDTVWEAGKNGVYDTALLDAAIARLRHPVPKDRRLAPHGGAPVLFVLDYVDGLRVSVLTHPGVIGGWSVAWRNAESQEVKSTLFWTQEARPFYHFGILNGNIEKMMFSGTPTYPMERTLLVSGALDAALISKRDGGRVVKTPYLEFSYESDFNWTEPPPPPPSRPVLGQ